MNYKTGFTAVFTRECKRIATSKICLWGIFGIAFIALVVLVYMMSSGLPSNIPTAVVDLDNSTTSRSLINQLDAFPKVDVKYKCASFQEARVYMERNEVYAMLVIPENFAGDASSGRQPKLVYYTNNAFLINGSLEFQNLKTIATLASASVGLKMGEAKGQTKQETMAVVQPISVEAHPLNNPWLNYSIYLNNILLPGILQVIILMFTVSSLGSEIKSGTGRYLVRLSGNSTFKLIVGKMLPYTITFTAIGLMYMAVLHGINAFPLHSGFIPMFLNYVCLILASQAFGLIIFSVFRNYRFSLSLACLIGILSIPVSGFSFPVSAMSPMVQALANLFPLRHFFLIYIDQGLNGIPIGYSAYHYAALLCFVIVSMLLWGRIKTILKTDTYKP